MHYGFNRALTTSLELSAVGAALSSARANSLSDSILFTTRFPMFQDMTLILTYGFSAVYFFGEVDDPDAVRLINEWNGSNHKYLEMVKLQAGDVKG